MKRQQNVSDEIIFKLAKQAQLTTSFMLFMVSAGVLTAVGLLTNSVPVLIGGMVVAPVLPPLQLAAFGLAGGQLKNSWLGMRNTLAGVMIAILAAVGTTWFLNVSDVLNEQANLLYKPLLEERVRPGWYSVLVALAAGAAGSIATAKRKMDTLVGVVASVAIVPAGSAGGIALLSGDGGRALGGFTLLAVNLLIILGASILVIAALGRTLQEDV